jgi:peptidoglycan/xylan/chitin deacetylase (PgdA/CDA1 family)
MYHSLDESGSVVSVSPEVFAEQMAALAEAGFAGISLRQAVEHRKAAGDWPARSVVITFDDAYANVHDHGLPILKRFGFGATIYVIAGYVGRTNNWATLPPGMGELPLMSWEQVRDAADAGVEIGAHTMTHPDLTKLSREEIERELAESRDAIAERLGERVETFAYPYGHMNNIAAGVAARTFAASCTTILRRASNQPLNELPRVDVYYTRTCEQLERCVQGRLDGYLALRRWGRAVKAKLAVN